MKCILRMDGNNIVEEKLIYHKTSSIERREVSSGGKCADAGGWHRDNLI